MLEQGRLGMGASSNRSIGVVIALDRDRVPEPDTV
jgi:hypothetical protein